MNTSDELFDIVDREDQVVGRERREVVHAKGLMHRAVHLLVFNECGDLFLQKRSLLKDTAAGKWCTSCSGHVDAGEDYDVAVLREAGEEIGLYLATVPERLFYLDACPETGNEFVWVYRVESEGPFDLDPYEVEEGIWRSVSWIDQAIEDEPTAFAGSFCYLWNEWKKRL